VNGHGEVIGRIRSDPALDAPDLQIQTTDVPYDAPPLQPSHSARLGYSIVFSAMPASVTANTNATVYGIAERAAALICA
jgi:hypothetical protein